MQNIPKNSTVVVALSGGVDSSVACALLKQEGYNVIALFMKNWEEEIDGVCSTAEDFADVARVATALQVPYYTVNFSAQYKKEVFDHFLDGLKKGNTPNPDILCNREIKFKLLLDAAKKLGANFLATGHYAQKSSEGYYKLLKGDDPEKDQSYFLYTLHQDILRHVLFPVGHLKKKEVRAIAKKQGLATAEKKDSTGICFIGERNFRNFIHGYLGYTPGFFEQLDGTRVGTHHGVAYYTIGQRKGLAIGGKGDAWFVVGKDVARNIVFVEQGANHPALFAQSLTAYDPSWIYEAPQTPFECSAKIRYRQHDQQCIIEKVEHGKLYVRFAVPQRAITPEQSIVFYKNKECIGGAIIECAKKMLPP